MKVFIYLIWKKSKAIGREINQKGTPVILPLNNLNPLFFQVQELTSPPRASQVVKECAQACMQTTYQFLYDNAIDLYARQFQVCRHSHSIQFNGEGAVGGRGGRGKLLFSCRPSWSPHHAKVTREQIFKALTSTRSRLEMKRESERARGFKLCDSYWCIACFLKKTHTHTHQPFALHFKMFCCV